MRQTLHTIAVVLCVTSVTTAGAMGTDVPIPGKVTVVKGRKLAKFVSRATTSSFPLPAPGSPEDPTQFGAELSFFDTASPGGGVARFSLDSSGWTGLGNPAGSKGYRYKGRDDAADPAPRGTCQRVLLKERVIKAVCKGTLVTLATPFAASEGVVLGVPAGTASTRYCAEFGGDERKNDAKLLKRRNAPAPATCPDPGLPGFEPRDVITLAADELNGRDNGTAGSIASQDFLLAELERLGAEGLNGGQSGDAAFKQTFAGGTNILGVIPGDELPNEYVIVGAHYDHLGTSCDTSDPGDTICNGATDNAAGVAAVLAIGRTVANLPDPPRRSVILAFWDREEDGLLGSLHYVQNPLVPLANTVTYVNFDIQGANLLPSLRNFSVAVGAETGGTELQTIVNDAISGESLGTRSLRFIFGQGRSDYVNFFNAGVPVVFFSDSTGGCYHTSQDEIDVVDFTKLEKQARIGLNVVSGLIETTAPPSFVAPPGLASFDDAVVINDVVNAGIADLKLFDPADQATVLQFQSDLNTIVAEGAGNFDSNDVTTLLLGTLDVINILTRVECDGFL